MVALILNSGIGARMGVLSSEQPKCMTEISSNETIISRQLKLLAEVGVENVVITTGRFEEALINYCQNLNFPLHIEFIKNREYACTNYIYSIYCAKDYLNDDILMMHGDLVFEKEVLEQALRFDRSCMVVSSTVDLPEKDFKAVIKDGVIYAVGVEFFDEVVAAQPLYKLKKEDWKRWLESIVRFCEEGNKKVYAENALNVLKGKGRIFPLDVKNKMCSEVDNPEDLMCVMERLKRLG